MDFSYRLSIKGMNMNQALSSSDFTGNINYYFEKSHSHFGISYQRVVKYNGCILKLRLNFKKIITTYLFI